ncbi:peptidase domain-containing ABC transporter [Pedobacter rhodius]|uniref:Peptidase domain-containing ABC transporter n=1 Tax=Pedobacter rhodius TaxID=3004098 RepID=A0ABT4KYI0_9SPHI|nr:peptidase domain-containing ABC transporter [Pedobacter sp. SJ11]MCZ4223995.1 peptidase domain-containing ABC transporter [Pedobacter sp. SJ11]
MKFPHYTQLEARDCGPTCLKIVARFYGKNYSMAELKDYCAVTRQGVSLQDIINGASNIGFDTLSVKLTLDNIKTIPLPAILYWRQEHYVVLYNIKERRGKRTYFISDPSFGRIPLREEFFDKQWTNNENAGIALLLEPTQEFHDKVPIPTEKNLALSKIGSYFLAIIKNNRFKSALSLFLILVAMVGTWLFPSVFRKMIDNGVMAKDINVVFYLLAAQFIIFVSQIISDSISSILLMQINFKVSLQFLVNYLHKLIRLPLKIFDNRLNSDLMMRMDDSDRIQNFLSHHSIEFLISVLSLGIFSVLLCSYNVFAFLIFIVMSIFSILWTLLFLDKRKLLDYSRFTAASETKNNIYELINEMPEIKINNAHENKISQWEGLQKKLNKINLEALNLNYYQLIGANFFNRSKDILITGLCAYFVIQGTMSIGVMMVVGYIIGQLNTPINNLINIIRGLQDAKMSFDRLEDIQRLDNEDVNRNTVLKFSPVHSIQLKNVSFKYEGSFNNNVLENLNLEIPVGKITAIVGSSGSGKTTLLKLLLSIYNPGQGSIYLDDVNLQTVVPDSWRTRCGVVFQDGYIYSGTYAENIALADAKPDMVKLKYACELACIDEFIESLPMQYNSRIGRTGANLSGGQKQRLLIARAIYRDPDFIFFDEATSSLDANNEKKILNNLNEFFKGKTVVIIAHRLSTVKKADQIIVMEKGSILEQNTHNKLIAAKGKYYELIKNQLELGN